MLWGLISRPRSGALLSVYRVHRYVWKDVYFHVHEVVFPGSSTGYTYPPCGNLRQTYDVLHKKNLLLPRSYRKESPSATEWSAPHTVDYT